LRRGHRLVPPSPCFGGAGLPSHEGMERREAPGNCATAPLGGLRGLPGTPCDRGTHAPCKDGLARPVPRRARAVIWRLARPRHRDAAPPGAPPADADFSASAPKEKAASPALAFGLARPARRVMTATGEQRREVCSWYVLKGILSRPLLLRRRAMP
jgi:hypothetical protein